MAFCRVSTVTAFRGAGCALAGLGAVITAMLCAPRAAFSLHGGVEHHARDLSVIFVELPLVVLFGALLPVLAWWLTRLWVRRPWVAVVTAVAALALGVWGVLEWWTPRQGTDPDYGPGT